MKLERSPNIVKLAGLYHFSNVRQRCQSWAFNCDKIDFCTIPDKLFFAHSPTSIFSSVVIDEFITATATSCVVPRPVDLILMTILMPRLKYSHGDLSNKSGALNRDMSSTTWSSIRNLSVIGLKSSIYSTWIISLKSRLLLRENDIDI